MAKKARAVVWLQKKGKHVARQALAEKGLRAIGRLHVRTFAHRAREIKVQRYSAKKFLIKIGRHAAKRAKVISWVNVMEQQDTFF